MVQKLLNKMLYAFGALTGFYTVIQSDHRYIHRGWAFSGIVDLGTISTTQYIGFTTPTGASGKYVHWRPIGADTSANFIKITLYEGDTYTGGSAVTPINRNRVLSDLTTDMQDFKSGVASTPSGTPIQIAGIGTAGNPTSRSGGAGGSEQELVLKADTSYVIEIVPDGSTDVTFDLYWYEEDGYDGTES